MCNDYWIIHSPNRWSAESFRQRRSSWNVTIRIFLAYSHWWIGECWREYMVSNSTAALFIDFSCRIIYFPVWPLIGQWSYVNVSRLYVLQIRPQKLIHVPPPSNITLPGLNSTINLKDNSQWLDNLSPGDILLQDVLVTETISESKNLHFLSFTE